MSEFDNVDEDIPVMQQTSTGVRRALTMRNNVARQVAVNFMPSRQLSYNTIRLRRNNSSHHALLEEQAAEEEQSAERQADIIVREMELHQQLMEDNPEAEELRREALRDLPQGLTMKRHVRAKLSASVSNRSRRKPISVWRRFKYRMGFAWKRSKDRVRNFVFSIELWYEAIRKIEGHFGSAVGSYFYFLRWLFALDVMLLVLLMSFVVGPQILHDNYLEKADREWGFLDFISGKGSFEDSLLFYGHYLSGNVVSQGPTYSMTFAYFFTMLCVYLLFFGVLCYRTAYSYRLNFIETGGGVRHALANKMFSGWDFGIATEQAAALNARSILNELKELLAEQNRQNVVKSLCTKVTHYTVNIILTAFVLGFIMALWFGFWILLRFESTTTQYWEIIISSIITIIIGVCPVIFSTIVRLEYYSPRTALYVTLLRTCLLDFGTLFLLFYFWAISDAKCWETSFGQEAYRLVLLDVLISLVMLPLFEFIRGLLYKLNPKMTPPEFNIAYNSLTLIYNQAVLWFGMLFSPLLVVAVTFKFLLLFYIKRFVAMYTCAPAKKVWRAAQTQTVMYMMITLSLFITLFGTGSLFLRSTSQACGPFREYDHVFAVLTEGVLRLSSHAWLRTLLTFITKPGVIAFFILLLCVMVYYTRAKSLAQRSMVGILRQMLVIEAKDKDFLLSAIAKVSNGEWLYSPKIEDAPLPDSHTWKYLHDDKVRKPSNSGFAFDSSRLNHSLLEGGSRPRSYVAKDNRPNSYLKDGSKFKEDGDTDSSFSWQGSSSRLNDPRGQVEDGRKDWI